MKSEEEIKKLVEASVHYLADPNSKGRWDDFAEAFDKVNQREAHHLRFSSAKEVFVVRHTLRQQLVWRIIAFVVALILIALILLVLQLLFMPPP
jgi:hypothetical protein